MYNIDNIVLHTYYIDYITIFINIRNFNTNINIIQFCKIMIIMIQNNSNS